MMTTQQQTLPLKNKPADNDQAMPKRDRDRAEKPVRSNRVEQLDWRGEGVVGNNHTD